MLGSEQGLAARSWHVVVGRLSSQNQHGRPATAEAACVSLWSKSPCMAAMTTLQSQPPVYMHDFVPHQRQREYR